MGRLAEPGRFWPGGGGVLGGVSRVLGAILGGLALEMCDLVAELLDGFFEVKEA